MNDSNHHQSSFFFRWLTTISLSFSLFSSFFFPLFLSLSILNFFFSTMPWTVPSSGPSSVRCSAPSSESLFVTWDPPPTGSINGLLQGYKVSYRPLGGNINGTSNETPNSSFLLSSSLSLSLTSITFSQYHILFISHSLSLSKWYQTHITTLDDEWKKSRREERERERANHEK